ncbi:hypothetical protein LV84_04322, partial [Algoriphagus ratkowskyi]
MEGINLKMFDPVGVVGMSKWLSFSTGFTHGYSWFDPVGIIRLNHRSMLALFISYID